MEYLQAKGSYIDFEASPKRWIVFKNEIFTNREVERDQIDLSLLEPISIERNLVYFENDHRFYREQHDEYLNMVRIDRETAKRKFEYGYRIYVCPCGFVPDINKVSTFYINKMWSFDKFEKECQHVKESLKNLGYKTKITYWILKGE